MKQPVEPHILLMGPGTDHPFADLLPVGGATRSFKTLMEYMHREGVEIQLGNTQEFRGQPLKNFWERCWQAVFSCFSTNIIFLNASLRGITTLGPALYIIARLTGSKIVIRPFGGAFDQQYRTSNPVVQWLLRNTVLKADILFLQTERLMQFFQPLAKNAIQLATSRPDVLEKASANTKPYQKRFVFVGMMTEAKGVWTLHEASKQLDDSYTVHMYGPPIDELKEELVTTHYQGVLKPEAVQQKLQEYDVLVLPTHYQGEGYPGVIIEAYSMGLPVIASDWKSIPELVEHGVTGLLVPPQDATALANAMKAMNEETHGQLSQSARQHFLEHYESERVLGQMLQQLRDLL